MQTDAWSTSETISPPFDRLIPKHTDAIAIYVFRIDSRADASCGLANAVHSASTKTAHHIVAIVKVPDKINDSQMWASVSRKL